jgi:hypothetical protein
MYVRRKAKRLGLAKTAQQAQAALDQRKVATVDVVYRCG